MQFIQYSFFPTAHNSKLVDYTKYLKSLYRAKTLTSSCDDDHWPPPVTDKVFRLAMIMAEQVQRRQIKNDFVRKSITGKVDDILRIKVPIELRDIFIKINHGKRKTVLIEGGPGCGKSTLSLHICHNWSDNQLFKEYHGVILVRLRESIVQNAKRIADVLPRRDENMAYNIEKEMNARDGEGFLFVFDGWDELPESAPGRSIIMDILKGAKLHKSAAIITSRPTSSMSLYRVVQSRIEILGFTKEELQLYFAGCLEGDSENVDKLQQKIRENPIVEGSCYLPLNASILVHLFKFNDNMLPKTQFGIFSALTCNCIFRHLKKSHNDISEIKSLDGLPQLIEGPFKEICAMAYSGIMEDKIIFCGLSDNFNTLGLLQGVESFAISGRSHSYNFLHLSVQELLAALHMATQLEPSQQVEQFQKLFGHARFSAVFQFYAAKTKLQVHGIHKIVVDAVRKCITNPTAVLLNSDDSDSESNYSDSYVVTDYEDHEPQPLLMSLLHCLFEAHDMNLCHLVAKELGTELNLRGITLNPADCLSVGYFLTYCKDFKVDLQRCSIGDDGCQALFKPGEGYNLQTLK